MEARVNSDKGQNSCSYTMAGCERSSCHQENFLEPASKSKDDNSDDDFWDQRVVFVYMIGKIVGKTMSVDNYQLGNTDTDDRRPHGGII